MDQKKIGALYTSGYLAKIKTFKKRLRHKTGKSGGGENGMDESGNNVFCMILCIILYALAAVCCICAILGHTSAYSAAISCLCAATVLAVRQKRKK